MTALAVGITALLPLAAMSQDLATNDGNDTALIAAAEAEATEDAAQDVVSRWRADPTTIFDAAEISLDDLVFIARPLLVFADTPNDPNFTRQIDLLRAGIAGLALRDVIVISDTDPAARSAVRQAMRPRGFGLILVDTDGRIAQRKPTPWDVRELQRAIDMMPSRIQDIRDRQGGLRVD